MSAFLCLNGLSKCFELSLLHGGELTVIVLKIVLTHPLGVTTWERLQLDFEVATALGDL